MRWRSESGSQRWKMKDRECSVHSLDRESFLPFEVDSGRTLRNIKRSTVE